MINNQFNAATPKNQTRQVGPNFCPFCDFWHPVASMLGDHLERNHAVRLPQPERPVPTRERLESDMADRAERIAAMKRRKAERDAKRGITREAS